MTVDEVLEKIKQAKTSNDKRFLNMHMSLYLGMKDQCIGYIQDISGCDFDIASQVYDIKLEDFKNKLRKMKRLARKTRNTSLNALLVDPRILKR